MLDLTNYEELKPAPLAVFQRLEERRARVRFMVPEGDDWRAVTYGAYAKAIRRMALFLRASGFKPGERGAIFAQNRVEWMVSAMAIQSAGGVMVPIYPASTPAQAGYVVRHSDASVLFVDGKELLSRLLAVWGDLAEVKRIVLFDAELDLAETLRALKAKTGAEVPSLDEVEAKIRRYGTAIEAGADEDAAQPGAFETMLAGLTLEQNALMLYTSGTTGNPKGVPLTYKNVGYNGLDWLRNFAPLLAENYVDVLWLPMSHIFGFGEACIGDSLGYTTYLADPATALARLREVRPDVFFSVPAYWEKLAMGAAEEAEPDMQRKRLMELTGGRLKFCLSGGAGLKREVKELLYKHGLLVLEGYGLSECSPTLTLNRPNDFRFDSVGKPLGSVELRLADDGEILAKGPNVFSGYHKEPEATREVFTEDGWFKTGDVGRYTEDGFLQIIDRKKEILVTAGGKNVPPANIELRFADNPLCAHVVVYGEGKKFLTAGVWLAPEETARRLEAEGIGNGARQEAVKAWVQKAVDTVNAELAKFEQIKKFRIMEVPLTVAGGHLTSTLKVRRKKVWEAFRAEFEAMYEES